MPNNLQKGDKNLYIGNKNELKGNMNLRSVQVISLKESNPKIRWSGVGAICNFYKQKTVNFF